MSCTLWIVASVAPRPGARSATGDALCAAPGLGARASLSRRAFLLSLAALSGGALDASALCGEPDPFFAHFVDWMEDVVPLGPRTVHYRVLGSRRKEAAAHNAPIVYLGDAAVTLSSAEPLELLAAADRRFLMADLLGVGESQPVPVDPATDWLALAVEEITTVLDAASFRAKAKAKTPVIPPVHFIAAGFGIRVANALLRRSMLPDARFRVASVTAEGWHLPISPRNLTFGALQGDRICARESAQSGNAELLKAIYGTQIWNPVDDLKQLADAVPTLAIRMEDVPPFAAQSLLLQQHSLQGTGRMPHLAATDEFVERVNKFFDEVDRVPDQT